MNQSILEVMKSRTFILSGFLGTFLVLNVFILGRAIVQNSNNQQIVDQMLTLKDIRFHVVQVQQFLTDMAVTHDLDVLHEAKEQKKYALTKIAYFKKLRPDLKIKFNEIENHVSKVYVIGQKMAMTYIKEGRDKGNQMMKASGGLDEISLDLSSDIKRLAKVLVEN